MCFMDEALKEAYVAFEEGEVPVGVVIVKDNKIIARAHNLKEKMMDVTKHAEIIAIQKASKVLKNWRLNGCEMYVTLEPCIMCMGAIIQSRVSKLHIGTFNKDMGACGSVINLSNNRSLNSFVGIDWCYDERCSEVLNDFFNNKRK
ncbi:MAG: nucleoside deaminase [Clostridiales bacterium]|nr:nucleoside deaminase [Clostridiales bacterium]